MSKSNMMAQPDETIDTRNSAQWMSSSPAFGRDIGSAIVDCTYYDDRTITVVKRIPDFQRPNQKT